VVGWEVPIRGDAGALLQSQGLEFRVARKVVELRERGNAGRVRNWLVYGKGPDL